MGIFNIGKKYIKCKQNDDQSLECLSYKPTKSGQKIPVATIRAQLDPSCSLNLIDQDGDPSELAVLEEHLSKRAKIKCNKSNPEI